MSRPDDSYAVRLERTLTALQARVKEQEAALHEIRYSTAVVDVLPSENVQAHLGQLSSLKQAYDSVQSEPRLPSAESPIPALLALRATQKTVAETQESISQTQNAYLRVSQRLSKEYKDQLDAKLLRSNLESRIALLQSDLGQRTQKSPSQLIREWKRQLKTKKAENDAQVAQLITAFNSFVDSRLALMLAAEELGGPIVGETMDLNLATLGSGFNAQGKVKTVKANPNDGQRQRRIDEIWGQRPHEDTEIQEPWDEEQAAGAEMRELTEKLLNSLVEAGGNGPGTYVTLQRESAAARFLVRSKVAQFHPKDSKQLRLIDFGGEPGS
ncbi:hypothetical protein PVAG01_09203 [Phlyctema vagabunda]|uniref:Uncharacterized protein n=1 Tax=Phlyctema vagabunda TaxID=108571 RepID=A0ABR4P6P3_9HELO